MGNTFYFEWEVRLMEWLQAVFGNGVGLAIASFFTEVGADLAAIAIMGLFYWGLNKELGKYIGINVCVTTVWNPFLKNIFLRRRPYFDNPSIKILKAVEPEYDVMDIQAQGYSFPSGHSSNSGTVYWTSARKANKKWLKIVLIILPFFVGLSRSVVGAHYPTDVMAGWTLALVVVFFIPWLRQKINKDWLFFVILLLVGLPGFFFCNSNDYFTGYGIMVGLFGAFLFEEKFVKFENTNSIIRALLRTIVGGALFLAINAVCKLPYSKEFLESGTMGAMVVRFVRYAIASFVVAAIYPLVFKHTAKIGKKD